MFPAARCLGNGFLAALFTPLFGLDAVVSLLGHLFARSPDNIGRVRVAGLFHNAVTRVPIWVLICHQLNLWGVAEQFQCPSPW